VSLAAAAAATIQAPPQTAASGGAVMSAAETIFTGFREFYTHTMRVHPCGHMD